MTDITEFPIPTTVLDVPSLLLARQEALDAAALSSTWSEGTQPAGPGTKSSREHAEDAQLAAAAAGAQANNAGAQAQVALTQAGIATTQAGIAATQASAAAGSATAAAAALGSLNLPFFATVAAGIAGVAVGQSFTVPLGANGGLEIRERTGASTSTVIGTILAPTQSATDTTAGRLVKARDYGWGVPVGANAFLNPDINNPGASGAYTYSVDPPVHFPSGFGGVISFRGSAARYAPIAISTASPGNRMFFRQGIPMPSLRASPPPSQTRWTRCRNGG